MKMLETHRIVESMPRDRRVSTSTVARHAGVDVVEAERHLEALTNVGVVEEVDDRLANTRVWRLTVSAGER